MDIRPITTDRRVTASRRWRILPAMSCATSAACCSIAAASAGTVVLVDDGADIRSLQIIGADCAGLETALNMPEHPRPAAVATSVQLYRSDPRVCARVDAAINSGSTEVVLWGDTDSVGVKPQMIAVAHRISEAAATFKTHALAATPHMKPSTDIVIEKFLATRATWQPPDLQQSTLNRSESCRTVRF
jgi:hypothetical protein